MECPVPRTVSLRSNTFGRTVDRHGVPDPRPRSEATLAEKTDSLAGRREGAVLASLVLRAGAVVTADQLIDVLWRDDSPRSAAKTLQRNCVLRLRKTLGPNVIEKPDEAATGSSHPATRSTRDRFVASSIRFGRTAAVNGKPARAAGGRGRRRGARALAGTALIRSWPTGVPPTARLPG